MGIIYHSADVLCVSKGSLYVGGSDVLKQRTLCYVTYINNMWQVAQT